MLPQRRRQAAHRDQRRGKSNFSWCRSQRRGRRCKPTLTWKDPRWLLSLQMSRWIPSRSSIISRLQSGGQRQSEDPQRRSGDPRPQRVRRFHRQLPVLPLSNVLPIGGTLTSIKAMKDGLLQFSVTGLTLDVQTVYSYTSPDSGGRVGNSSWRRSPWPAMTSAPAPTSSTSSTATTAMTRSTDGAGTTSSTG